MNLDAQTRWSKLRVLLTGLWPEWNPTNEQSQEWARALAFRNYDAMTNAIRAHYHESKWREPRLPEILKKFKAAFTSNSEVAAYNSMAGTAARDEKAAVELHERMLRDLMRIEPDEIASAAKVVRERYMTFVPQIMRDDDITIRAQKKAIASRNVQSNTSESPGDWSRMMVGFVWTLIFNPPDTYRGRRFRKPPIGAKA